MKRKRRKSSVGADPVADVGGDEHALQRRRLLARHQRLAHPQPGGRRAELDEPAGDEAHLHRRVVAVLLLGREELGARCPSSGGAGGWLATGRLAGQVDFGVRSRQARARISASPSPSLSSASTICTRRPGPTTRASPAPADRDRARGSRR